MGQGTCPADTQSVWSTTQKLGKHPPGNRCHPDSLPSSPGSLAPRPWHPWFCVSWSHMCPPRFWMCLNCGNSCALNHFAQCQFGSLLTFLNISMINSVCLRLFLLLWSRSSSWHDTIPYLPIVLLWKLSKRQKSWFNCAMNTHLLKSRFQDSLASSLISPSLYHLPIHLTFFVHCKGNFWYQ